MSISGPFVIDENLQDKVREAFVHQLETAGMMIEHEEDEPTEERFHDDQTLLHSLSSGSSEQKGNRELHFQHTLVCDIELQNIHSKIVKYFLGIHPVLL